MLLILGFAIGCHQDTNQGGAPDKGTGATQQGPNNRSREQSITPSANPPSADRQDPSSPNAVINGTSTANPGKQDSPAPIPPPRHAPPQRQ